MSDHITLVGNIVGEPEERATRGGESIAAFRLAVSERRFDRERGQWVDGHTNYYAVSVFGDLGRHTLASVRKGERVVVAGRLRLREWENETKRGVSADVTADAIGHDLRWGTTVFRRTPRGEATRPGDDTATPPAAEVWAIPGESPTEGAPDEPLGKESTAPAAREAADVTPF